MTTAVQDRPTKWKSFPEVLAETVAGNCRPLNLDPMTNDEAVREIAAYSWTVTKGSILREDGHTAWATYFTSGTQAGQFDGSGFVLYYDAGKGRAARFSICKHKKVLGPNDRPNHQYGWHPGHCEHCGLDLSVDSGD